MAAAGDGRGQAIDDNVGQLSGASANWYPLPVPTQDRQMCGEGCSMVAYFVIEPKEITDEDKIIETYKINVKPADVVIVPVEKVFQ